ncbi:MAG: ABC transporter substrate-binding protein [Clostridiales bacterium]|nr:ABC transporter substrate-binding protein [Clostridiales bacterium]
MKKLAKKISALLLAVVMIVACFAACGKNNSNATLKIGGIGPITGPAAVYGQAVKNAAELAVKEINAAGGINGMQVEFSWQDDEHDAEKAVTAYNTLKDWGMQILMGTVTSAPCTAVVASTKEDNMFQLTPSGSAVESIAADNAFRVCFSDPNQGIASAKYIGTNNLAKKVGVIYNSSDVYSTGIYNKFKAEAENQPFEIVAAEAFTDTTKTNFTTQLNKIKAAGAELLFLPIYYQEAALILTQANSMGFKPIFFGCDGLDGLLAVDNFDKALAEGVILLTPFAADATDEKTVKFVADYKAAYNNEVPNQFAADAYDAIYTIKAAAEKANINSNMSVSDICDAMKTAMTQITVTGLTGTITWTADGEASKDPKTVKIVDGAYKAM